MTINKIISKIDDSFNERNAGDYELTLVPGETITSWSIFDKEKNQYILLESFRNRLSELDFDKSFLRLPYRKTRIIIENNNSSLIPEPLFDPSEISSYLSVTVDLTEQDRYFHNRLNQLEIINVYTIPENLIREFDPIFPEKQLFHISTVLIDSIWMNYKNQLTGTRLYIYVREEDFNLVIFDKNQLIYNNAFYFKAPEDFIYFIIFVMEQLDLNPEEVPVTLMGAIDRNSPLFVLLYRYIRNIEFASRNEVRKFSYVFDDLPEHQYYPLLTRIS